MGSTEFYRKNPGEWEKIWVGFRLWWVYVLNRNKEILLFSPVCGPLLSKEETLEACRLLDWYGNHGQH